MSDVVFTLQVPAAPEFRALARDVACRYVEMRGGADRDALAAALDAEIEALALSGTPIELACRIVPLAVELTLRTDGRSSVVRHPLPPATS